MKIFRMTISTPDGNLFDGDIQSISLRGAEGELAVMAGHTPFVTITKAGVCRLLREDNTETSFETEEGILSVWENKAKLVTYPKIKE